MQARQRNAESTVSYDPKQLMNDGYVFVRTASLMDSQTRQLYKRFAIYRDSYHKHFAVDLDEPLKGRYVHYGVDGLKPYCGPKHFLFCYDFVNNFESSDKAGIDEKAIKEKLNEGLISETIQVFTSRIKENKSYKKLRAYIDDLTISLFGKTDEKAKAKGEFFLNFLNELNTIITVKELEYWMMRLDNFSAIFNAYLLPRENKITFFGHTLFDFTASNKESTKSFKFLSELQKEVSAMRIKVFPQENRSITAYCDFPEMTVSAWHASLDLHAQAEGVKEKIRRVF